MDKLHPVSHDLDAFRAIDTIDRIWHNLKHSSSSESSNPAIYPVDFQPSLPTSSGELENPKGTATSIVDFGKTVLKERGIAAVSDLGCASLKPDLSAIQPLQTIEKKFDERNSGANLKSCGESIISDHNHLDYCSHSQGHDCYANTPQNAECISKLSRQTSKQNGSQETVLTGYSAPLSSHELNISGEFSLPQSYRFCRSEYGLPDGKSDSKLVNASNIPKNVHQHHISSKNDIEPSVRHDFSFDKYQAPSKLNISRAPDSLASHLESSSNLSLDDYYFNEIESDRSDLHAIQKFFQLQIILSKNRFHVKKELLSSSGFSIESVFRLLRTFADSSFILNNAFIPTDPETQLDISSVAHLLSQHYYIDPTIEHVSLLVSRLCNEQQAVTKPKLVTFFSKFADCTKPGSLNSRDLAGFFRSLIKIEMESERSKLSFLKRNQISFIHLFEVLQREGTIFPDRLSAFLEGSYSTEDILLLFNDMQKEEMKFSDFVTLLIPQSDATNS